MYFLLFIAVLAYAAYRIAKWSTKDMPQMEDNKKGFSIWDNFRPRK